jgi:hypothetical protein
MIPIRAKKKPITQPAAALLPFEDIMLEHTAPQASHTRNIKHVEPSILDLLWGS